MTKYYYIGGIVLISLFFSFCTLNNEGEKHIEPLLDEELLHQKRVDLGRSLFFEKRLSIDNTISCASCHIPELAFTDGKRVSIGVNGLTTNRNSPSILNLKNSTAFMFDAHIDNLEEQVIVPIQEHTEMNIKMGELVKKIKKLKIYQNASREAYSRDFDAWVLTRSIAEFERTLISDNSSFDQFIHGDTSSFTDSQIRGWKIFSEDLKCLECHSLPHFTNNQALNNGLYKDYGADQGRFRIHHDSLDIGKFKVPSLRNITLTGPYMHDGSIKTLKEVIEHYSQGGKGHWNQDPRIKPFSLNHTELSDLINFFNGLTDTSYMSNF